MMNFVESILLNTVLLLCPLLIYLIYLAYKRNLNQEERGLFLEVALFSSLYLIMRFGSLPEQGASIILFHVPLLIGYLKGRKITPLLLSGILIWYYVSVMHFHFFFVFFEYAIYYCVYVYITKKKITTNYLLNTFVLIKSFILAFETFCFLTPNHSFFQNFFEVFVVMLTFYVVSYVIFYLLRKGEETMSLANTIKELEKEKMLRASLFKITHEIKNPIAVCKGYLDMLDLNNEEKVHKYIPIIQQEISRTLTLMDDYLDYTKIKIEKEEIDLYLLIEDTCASLESLFKQNGIITKFQIPDDELYMMLDYNRMKQVLVNVFKNAMEAKKPEKQMTIWLNVRKDKNQVVLTIRDNGVGMDDETLSKVSEMFYTTKKKGSGLGVSLSKEIVELHGGKMFYDSTLGKGTKVTIVLPVQESVK